MVTRGDEARRIPGRIVEEWMDETLSKKTGQKASAQRGHSDAGPDSHRPRVLALSDEFQMLRRVTGRVAVTLDAIAGR